MIKCPKEEKSEWVRVDKQAWDFYINPQICWAAARTLSVMSAVISTCF